MRYRLCIFLLALSLSSCSCDPESLAKFAVSGMETMMGEGFMPSDEIRALGNFQGMSVNLSQSTTDGETESTIFLQLQNGDPVALGRQPEVLARRCAELYLRDYEKSKEYEKITVQFLQSDPSNPENVAMQEYTFDVKDF
ncbi:hypothetical protein J0A68_04435 [Algoriphagus sp. H41]|uniref:Uncharacterized protein n=1 Tax=Algoriphagus oliviformis TaxID=2811231 RepID=A0ABS3BZB4_9BACT|nr:hypothetical protein [Algoriphagus oliviformis]MBN7810192.1 hypothetical protein [Algoriphagus oliviformis]